MGELEAHGNEESLQVMKGEPRAKAPLRDPRTLSPETQRKLAWAVLKIKKESEEAGKVVKPPDKDIR